MPIQSIAVVNQEGSVFPRCGCSSPHRHFVGTLSMYSNMLEFIDDKTRSLFH